MKKWNVLTAIITISMVLATTACGTSGKDSNGGGGNASATASPAPVIASEAPPVKVKKVIVGTSTTYPKVFFVDEKGNLTGFDVELVKEIDKRLPEYEFELQAMDFTNLLLSLETKKIDFIAAEMVRNAEREQKYLFNKEPYAFRKTKIIVSKENTGSFQTLDDLKGKKVLTNATSAQATLLENYNKSHDNAITIVYQSGAINDTVSQIASGRVDATLGADFTLPLIDPEGKLKTTGDPIESSDVRFVFRKDDAEEQKLADAIDKALQEIKAEGTLSKLSIEWLGADFTKGTPQ
ncbi:transporter substrate-binding domain-containing protein [Cohnella abietis]|uniref:L-cystine-binding protein TcyK n=1 Tax=Cohnella abietis TaxID=2507935 RepID=A0A3T1D3W8_9BACL|nr:transporter substrate-binding domain-containing protein [Cohnella abietis]BBI32741.1 L-cystine-binding protein TcyK [Cohnella abietis]